MASNLRVDSIVPATGSSVSIGTATGGVNIPGVLTYEDVTNVDSVGVITARDGLRVTGIATISGDVSIADKIIHTGDTNTSLRFPSADTITAETGGIERFRIASNGNVGVNTDFTGSQTWRNGQRLEIFGGSGNVTGEIHLGAIRSDANQSVGSVNFFDNGQDTNHKQIALIEADKAGSTSNKRGGDLIFFTKGDNVAAPTEKLRIDTNGNVTKPSNFHILVKRSGNQTGYNASSTSTPIIWNSVVTGSSSSGASSHFNTSTGLFTAPVTGLYFFHIGVNCNFSVEQAWLIINGSRANYSAINPNSAATSDQSLAYYVTAGQTVGTQWYDNGNTNATINANDLHTWWRIILLG